MAIPMGSQWGDVRPGKGGTQNHANKDNSELVVPTRQIITLLCASCFNFVDRVGTVEHFTKSRTCIKLHDHRASHE